MGVLEVLGQVYGNFGMLKTSLDGPPTRATCLMDRKETLGASSPASISCIDECLGDVVLRFLLVVVVEVAILVMILLFLSCRYHRCLLLATVVPIALQSQQSMLPSRQPQHNRKTNTPCFRSPNP